VLPVASSDLAESKFKKTVKNTVTRTIEQSPLTFIELKSHDHSR
jgi:hypothetical protein